NVAGTALARLPALRRAERADPDAGSIRRDQDRRTGRQVLGRGGEGLQDGEVRDLAGLCRGLADGRAALLRAVGAGDLSTRMINEACGGASASPFCSTASTHEHGVRAS